MKITIQDIKDFIDEEVGFDIAYNNNSNSKRKNEKVFCRWFLTYLSYKYANEYVTNKKISEIINIKPCTVVYGISEFENLASYDKKESKNFKMLEDCFIEKFNPDTKELLELIETDKLKLIKDNNKLRLQIKKAKIQNNNYRIQLNKKRKSKQL